MDWLKALRIGYGVIKMLDKEGVDIKGKDTGKIVEAVDQAITTTKTVKDIINAPHSH